MRQHASRERKPMRILDNFQEDPLPTVGKGVGIPSDKGHNPVWFLSPGDPVGDIYQTPTPAETLPGKVRFLAIWPAMQEALLPVQGASVRILVRAATPALGIGSNPCGAAKRCTTPGLAQAPEKRFNPGRWLPYGARPGRRIFQAASSNPTISRWLHAIHLTTSSCKTPFKPEQWLRMNIPNAVFRQSVWIPSCPPRKRWRRENGLRIFE